MAKFEVCAQKWADYSEEGYGVSLLNDCKYGHGVKEGTMSLTLLRSPHHPDPAQMLGVVPLKESYPETDQGLHEFTYVLMPHAGSFIDAGTVREAFDLNVPLRAVKTVSKKGALLPVHSFLSVNNGDIIIDTVKKAEDGKGTVLRFYEPHGSRQSVELDINFPFKKAYLTDMLERKEKQLKTESGRVKMDVKPFEIVTLKLE